jgi:methylenetetrahydrofolate reductase (NADPH)
MRRARGGKGQGAMRICDVLQFAGERGEPVFSFEFFPPKTEEGVRALFETVRQLHALAPAFVSVTWGAGGSTRGRTLEMVTRMKRELEIEAMAHVTCVGATRDELKSAIEDVLAQGIDNVLALRGDPPRGQNSFVATEGGLSYASELVQLVREVSEAKRRPICIGGACYPEGHVETRDLQADLRNCKKKVEAGAQFLITQLFFDNRHYFDFVGRARAAGIDVPIIPGIMPITNVDQVQRFTAMCGAHVPAKLAAAMKVRKDDPEGALQLGVAYATLQCADLLRRGAPGIHFYTLNRSPATRAILAALRAQEPWLDA